MPPKAKFTKQEIICAAVNIVEREGLDNLTARALGDELGSSARPIFTVFNSMDEVITEVYAQANAVYGSYVEKGLGEDIAFRGVGKAYIGFAADRPRLFQLLFMKERSDVPEDVSILMGIEEHYADILKSIEQGYGLDEKTAKELYFHMWVYSHGIAVLIATKVCAFNSEQTTLMISEV
ncbi:MAG: WHG domain-containing protein, partial [Clostridia bacterium]|nr:WHG domain-containing protein [Clostridia bacterium]